jgi:hypothetical protein
MYRFNKEFDAINSAIIAFNRHFATAFHVPQFDKVKSLEAKAIVKIIHKDWDSFPFPNNGTRGVYFLFGHEKTQIEKTGLYIGKASFNSTTSGRLYAHLQPCRKKDFYEMNGYRGEIYILDFMASIDLDKLEVPFLAPALEEYLISTLRKDLNLINGTGN